MNKIVYLNEMRVNVELVRRDLVKSLAHSEHAACHFRLMAKSVVDCDEQRYSYLLKFELEKDCEGVKK